MKRIFSLWRRTAAWMVLLAIVIGFTGYGTHIKDAVTDLMEYDVTAEPFHFAENRYHTANHYQWHTCPIELFVWNNTLYVFFDDSNDKPQYRDTLCKIQNGELVPIKDNVWRIIGSGNGYVYFQEHPEQDPYDQNDRIMHLSCLDLSENHFYWLPSKDVTPYFFDVVNEDGSIYTMSRDNPEKHYILKDGQILDSVETDFYTLGGNRYMVNIKGAIFRYTAAGDEERIYGGSVWDYALYPCENGLLVHEPYGVYLLTLIPEDTQEPVRLLECCPYAFCAANVHNGYVYVSMERRAGYNPFLERHIRSIFETIYGTYRISLEDYSIERLSDEVYKGLYIFDDAGIYAVQDSRVCKLDFDGNEIMTILE